jgi:hypothetical protein
MTDLATHRLGDPVPPLTARLALRDIAGITKRNLLRIIRTPQLVLLSIVQPALILVLFRYVMVPSEFPGSTTSTTSCRASSWRRCCSEG